MAETKRPIGSLRWLFRAAACVVLALLLAWSLLMMLIRSRRVPEELRKPPAALLAFEHLQAQSIPVSRRASDHPAWDRAEPPKAFEDYVRFQLERNPSDEGAKLYLALLDRFASEKFVEQWNALFKPPPSPESGWRPGDALNDDQRQWLLAHREMIEMARRMIAAGGPPMPLSGEFPRTGLAPRKSTPLYMGLFSPAEKLLAAESQRRREAQDSSGSADVLLDGYALSEEAVGQGILGLLYSGVLRRLPDLSLAGWLRDNPPDFSTLKRIQDGLDVAHDVTRRHVSDVAGLFADARSSGIYLQDQPVSHWLNGRDPMVAEASASDFYLFYKRFSEKPAFMWNQTYAVVRSKLRAETNLREFDALTVDMLKRFQGPYPSLDLSDYNLRLGGMSGNFSPFAWSDIITFWSIPFISISNEAGTNLNRAALRLLRGEKPAVDLYIDSNADAWLDSPWRDPFTEAPLHIASEADSILIYSLGPDLKDQRGTLAYDPTNGTLSEGDLALRVPLRK